MTMVNMSPATTSPAMASEAPTNGNGHSGNAIINCISAWIVEFGCSEVDRLVAILSIITPVSPSQRGQSYCNAISAILRWQLAGTVQWWAAPRTTVGPLCVRPSVTPSLSRTASPGTTPLLPHYGFNTRLFSLLLHSFQPQCAYRDLFLLMEFTAITGKFKKSAPGVFAQICRSISPICTKLLECQCLVFISLSLNRS